jgi:hypothetical protein
MKIESDPNSANFEATGTMPHGTRVAFVMRIPHSERTMTEHDADAKPRDTSADQRARETKSSDKKSGKTMTGQEAAQGQLPAEHDHEHQSNYGGGGENGGA